MKSILVPTDFSACAHYAYNAAAKLAIRFDAKLYLLSCIDIPENWHYLSEKEQQAMPDALQQIHNTEVLFADLRGEHPDLDIKTYYHGGKLIDIIHQYIEQLSVDFVVMGSHGVSGKSEYFIGSNTQKVVRRIQAPVLVVKDELQDINFDKVVFASTFHESEQPAFLAFKNFVKHFVPEIHLVEIHTSSLMDPPYILSKEAMAKFQALCAPFSCKTYVYRDYNIDKGIRAFSESIGAKLIGISNHHRRPLKRMLAGSNVEALVNHSDIPVLSIDFKKDRTTEL
jgi:nucleotide-binding universal stress UspA family protein